ncbi:MAG TPA: ribosome recycling factor [Chloroflexota bacterium]|jgi:ribosome recycling factor|nr:ribosome recycling factor [Chloroflexota bacterium]
MAQDLVGTIIHRCEECMRHAEEALTHDLASIRTGRASPALLERVRVDYYGTPTPLTQLAAISTPEPRLLVIQPWDKSAFGAIEKAILKSDLGLTPVSDGKVIRLSIPPLTEERRRDLVRLIRRRVEEGRVAIRNCRRDAIEEFKKLEREKKISEDDTRRGQERVQKATDAAIQEIERIGQRKEQEVMEI